MKIEQLFRYAFAADQTELDNDEWTWEGEVFYDREVALKQCFETAQKYGFRFIRFRVLTPEDGRFAHGQDLFFEYCKDEDNLKPRS